MDTNFSYVLRSETFEIENPDINIEVVPDDVRIVESEDGKSHIDIFARSENEKDMVDQIDISTSGNKISVRVRRRNGGLMQIFSGRSVHLDLVIKLPKTSLVKVKTISGDLNVDLGVRKLEANTISGDISVLQNPSEICTLNSISGDITARTFSGCHYSLRTISGDIKVHVAPNLEIDVDGKSISGDMKSDISLNSNSESGSDASELVVITANTISGDFALVRN